MKISNSKLFKLKVKNGTLNAYSAHEMHQLDIWLSAAHAKGYFFLCI